jgi:LysM repeat protein
MKSHQNWFKLVVLLAIAGLFLVACERPLPGGYNEDTNGSGDVTGPDAGAYPTESEGLPGPESAPMDAEGYPGVAPEAPAVDTGAEAYPADGGEPAAPAEGEEAVEQPAPTEGIDPPAEPYPAAPVEPAPEVTEEAPVAAPVEETAVTPGTHTVAAGENLYRIGLLYGLSWTEIAAANGLSDATNLTVGQVLIIPAPGEGSVEGEAAPAEEAAPVEEAAPTEEPTPAAETPSLPTTYIVKQGDNLFRIGLNFGVNWTDIVAANGIVNNFIYPGQELIIPAPEGASVEEAAPAETDAEEAPAAAPAAGGVTHVVEPGETVFGIAFRYKIPWTSLVEANAITSPFTLEPGQSLIIPES